MVFPLFCWERTIPRWWIGGTSIVCYIDTPPVLWYCVSIQTEKRFSEPRKLGPFTPLDGKRIMADRIWRLDFIYLAYKAARNGLGSEAKLAGQLGVSITCINRWKVKYPTFENAIKQGNRDRKSSAGATFRGYVYNRLPPKLKMLWEQIMDVENAPTAIQQVEALLTNAGEKARQHLFLYALTSNNFNVSSALRTLNMPRSRFDQWVTKDPDFGAMFREIIEYKKDFYENALIGSVASGETAAIIFANKTFNKDRGYNEKIDMNLGGSVNAANALNLDELDLSIEIRVAILEAIRKKKEEEEKEEQPDE